MLHFLLRIYREEAEKLGKGWVKNQMDGSVQFEVFGVEKIVARLVEWSRHDPILSKVDQVEVVSIPYIELDAFEIRF